MDINEVNLKVINNPTPYNVRIQQGNSLFLLGANGSGKSALLHSLFLQVKDRAKLILAYRNNTLTSNGVSVFEYAKATLSSNKKNIESKNSIRYAAGNLNQRVDIAITDFINLENDNNRKAVERLRNNEISKAIAIGNDESPLIQLNQLLKLSGLNIEIMLKNGQLLAKKPNSIEYSVVQLSDGEKNILLLCCNTLTESQGTIFFIDEPERHLHKTINSKLLRNLFKIRSDCFFVVATHEVYLPIDNGASAIILIRDSNWTGQNVTSWETDYIEDVNDIPEEFKETIIGGKKNIVFIEGNKSKSLDFSIYQIIYPEATFVPVENCRRVIESVRGMNHASQTHRILTYGIIDKDDRTDKQISDFLKEGIIALPCYSVESLYYSPWVIKVILENYAKLTGKDYNEIISKIETEAVKEIKSHKERLCKKMCEKEIRHRITSTLPTFNQIAKGQSFSRQLPYDEILNKEEAKFDKMITESDIIGLISRYPFRETGVMKMIENLSGIKKMDFQAMVRQRLVNDKEFKEKFRNEILVEVTKKLT